MPLPPAGRLGHALQLGAIRWQIAQARRRLRLEGPTVTWFSVPVAASLRSKLGDVGSLFYYQDRYDQFTGVDSSRLRTLIAALAHGCDVTVATSRELADDLRRLGADPMLVPHGVDFARFGEDSDAPADLGELERPLVGYVGIIDDFVALDAIRATADRLDRGTVVLVGPVNTDTSALSHPRIVTLGFRPYGAIPSYLAAFDCCVCPFEINRLTIAINPIKLREYLAAGRPVVATPLPSVLEYEDVVQLASTPEEFGAAVVAMLDPRHDTPEAREGRRARVRAESWDAVAARIRPALLALAGRAHPQTSPANSTGRGEPSS
jgi:glycosyltransferase involved in cell wall biosynthesis